MPTIYISFNVNDIEHRLLVMANAEKPDPDRIKTMLLAEARDAVQKAIRDHNDRRRSGRRP